MEILDDKNIVDRVAIFCCIAGVAPAKKFVIDLLVSISQREEEQHL